MIVFLKRFGYTWRNFHMDPSQTIHLLGRVISELESPAIFEIEERIRALAKARRGDDQTSAKKLQQEVSSLDTGEARAVAAGFRLASILFRND